MKGIRERFKKGNWFTPDSVSNSEFINYLEELENEIEKLKEHHHDVGIKRGQYIKHSGTSNPIYSK